MSSKQNVQDIFLNHVRKEKLLVTVFLSNGIKLKGMITAFDNFSLTLSWDGITQLVYKHSVSTIMPNTAISIFDLHNESIVD